MKLRFTKNERGALILIGTTQTNKLITEISEKLPANLASAKQYMAQTIINSEDWLILSGADPLEAERAAMDWTLRFWKYAKDSASRRVGLVEKELPLGTDPAKIP